MGNAPGRGGALGGPLRALGVGTGPCARLSASFPLAVGPGLRAGRLSSPATPRRLVRRPRSLGNPGLDSLSASRAAGDRTKEGRAFSGNQPARPQRGLASPGARLAFQSPWAFGIAGHGFQGSRAAAGQFGNLRSGRPALRVPAWGRASLLEEGICFSVLMVSVAFVSATRCSPRVSFSPRNSGRRVLPAREGAVGVAAIRTPALGSHGSGARRGGLSAFGHRRARVAQRFVRWPPPSRRSSLTSRSRSACLGARAALPAPWSRPSARGSLCGRTRIGVSGVRGRAGRLGFSLPARGGDRWGRPAGRGRAWLPSVVLGGRRAGPAGGWPAAEGKDCRCHWPLSAYRAGGGS